MFPRPLFIVDFVRSQSELAASIRLAPQRPPVFSITRQAQCEASDRASEAQNVFSFDSLAPQHPYLPPASAYIDNAILWRGMPV